MNVLFEIIIVSMKGQRPRRFCFMWKYTMKNKNNKTYSQFMEYLVPGIHHQMLLLLSLLLFPFLPGINQAQIPLSSLWNGTCFPSFFHPWIPWCSGHFFHLCSASAMQ